MDLTRMLQLACPQADRGTQMLVALVPWTSSVLRGYVLAPYVDKHRMPGNYDVAGSTS